MERLVQDIRFAARVLWKDKGFALTAILTLGICIGANAGIFAVVNAVLLQPLPVPDAGQLVHMYNSYPGAGVSDRGSTGVPDYYDRLRETDVFQEQALYNTRGVTLGQEGNPQRITAMASTPSLLRLLQAHPLRGRLFTDEDGEEGRTHKAVLTYATWQRLFGGRDDAIGKDVRINGEPYAVVGVLPRGFSFLDPDIELWLPVAFTAEEKSDDSRHSNNWSYIGRLKPGASVEQARQEIDALNARNLDRFPAFKQILINAGFHTVVVPLQSYLVRDIRSTLMLLWGGVAFVLLIGAVNITNLMLVRSTARTRELATRHALGAGLGRIGRQLLTETVLLTLVGAVLGLALGAVGLRALVAFGVDQTPQGTAIAMDATVVGFTAALALIVGVLIGLVPILNLRNLNLGQAFREEGRSGTSSRKARATRRVLVTAQIAFAFMLLIGAGLMLASFRQILAVRPGFDTAQVLTGLVSPPAARYADDASLVSFDNRFLERVRALPGVRAAGLTSNLPLSGNYSDSVILAEGYVMKPGESLISPFQTRITPGYFEAMNVPLLRGRFFTASDDAEAPRVIIVDERLAARFWGTADPVGRRLWQPDSAQELSSGPGPEKQVLHGRRRGRKRPHDRAHREGAGRELLLPDGAGCRANGNARRAQRRAARGARLVHPARAWRHRSRTAVLRCAADAGARGRVAHQPPDAHAAGVALRRNRAAARRSGPVRRADLPGRRSAGARSASAWRSAATRVASSRWSSVRGWCSPASASWRGLPAPSRSGARWSPSCSASGRWTHRSRPPSRSSSASVALLACAVPARRRLADRSPHRIVGSVRCRRAPPAGV